MKSPKPIVAGALVAGSLLVGTGIAAAVVLPDQAADAADVAEERTAQLETGQPEDPQAGAAEHRQNTAAEHGADDDETDEAEKTDSADVAATDAGDTGERPTDTHGYEVSTFVHETDLEGREKGAAVSEVARSNGQSEDAGKPESAGRSAETHGKP